MKVNKEYVVPDSRNDFTACVVLAEDIILNKRSKTGKIRTKVQARLDNDVLEGQILMICIDC